MIYAHLKPPLLLSIINDIEREQKREKKLAKIAKDALSLQILNKVVTLKNVQLEKYGRILADVYIGNIHLNEILLKERFAVKYDGGTKIKPTSWIKYKITGDL